MEVPTEKSTPVPLRFAIWVLPATPLLLSVTVKTPLKGPGFVGVNVTLIVHEAWTAREVLQLLVWA